MDSRPENDPVQVVVDGGEGGQGVVRREGVWVALGSVAAASGPLSSTEEVFTLLEQRAK